MAQKKEKVTAILGEDWGGSRTADRRKEGGMGGRRVSKARSSARRAQEARGWGPGAGCAKAEGTPGCFAGLTMARRLEVSHSGRAGRVSHRLPPGAQSRRV